MSNDKLPKFLRPFDLCRSGGVVGLDIAGYMSATELNNLPDNIKFGPDDKVLVKLNFAQQADGLCIVTGELKLTTNLICQRCLNSFAKEIVHQLQVYPVTSFNDNKVAPDNFEPLLLEPSKNGYEIITASWLSEELLLALPQVPMHEENDKLCITNDYFNDVQNLTKLN